MATGEAENSIKRESSKELLEERIKIFFIQLTRGCGQKSCKNLECASGRGYSSPPNEAAANAVRLAQQKATPCLSLLSKPTNGMVSPRGKDGRKGEEPVSGGSDEPMEVESGKATPKSKTLASSEANQSESTMETNEETAVIQFPLESNIGLTLSSIKSLISKTDSLHYKELTSTLWNVFSSPQILNNSFIIPECPPSSLSRVRQRTGILVDVAAV